MALLTSDAADKEIGDLEKLSIFEAFASVAILLQRRAANPVANFNVVMREPHLAWVAIEHIWAPTAQMAAALAVQFIQMLNGTRRASSEQISEAVLEFERKCGSMTAGHKFLYAEAVRRGIPVQFTPPNNLVFGYGKNRRRLTGGTSEKTPQLAVSIASDKSATIDALRNAGLPVPLHIPVKDIEQAHKAVEKVGYPLVVKPVNTDQGVGITVGVKSASELEAAYQYARNYSNRIAVEQFLPGDTFRMLVINGRFVAACRTQPTPIVGDGVSSISQLVGRINLSPLRGPGHQKPLSWLEFDDEAKSILKNLSLTSESILPFGRTIRLRTASNLSKGGQSVSVNDIIHPDNMELAELCARIIGLDITGIDFRTDAIDKSWKQAECGIIEVNPNPGTRMHWRPASGPSADVATPVFELLFPNNSETRIPIVAVTGTNGTTPTVKLIAHMLRAAGLTVGSTTTDSVVVGGRVVSRGDSAGPGPARRVLSVPIVDAAVLEIAPGGLINYGLGFDRCDVAVITNVAEDHIGELGVRSIEELAQVKATVARQAGAVVLNAENQWCLGMRHSLPGKKIILFSTRAGIPAVVEHLEAGGTAFVVSDHGDGDVIVRCEGKRADVILRIEQLPMTFNGKACFNVENALAAIAAADCVGVGMHASAEAAMSFLTGTAGHDSQNN